MRGPWWAAAQEQGQVAPLAGLREAFPQSEIIYLEGVSIAGEDASGVAPAAAAAEHCDVVVLCLGEAATGSGEAASRVAPGLPGQQQALFDAVCAAAEPKAIPVVVILFSGRPLIAPKLFDRAAAVIWAGFLGSEAGRALADVLSGRESPSGRTTIAWPRSVGQIPIFYAERPSGRPANPDDHFTSKYLDSPNSPQFPFGWGLGYGRFALSNLRVEPEEADEDARIEVLVDVVNEGSAAAEHVVFCFARDPVASVARPLLELKDFARAVAAPGQTAVVRFSIAASEFRFLGRDLAPIFEPGDLEILVGSSADRSSLLSKTIRLAEPKRKSPK
jgi:beta-glucosidase